MFLWLQLDRLSQGKNVEQHPSTLSIQEGNCCVINCTYSDSTLSYFRWYKQEHGKGPQLIIDIHSNVDKREDQRLAVLLNKTAKHLSLNITATQPGDSAVYFCGASTHCRHLQSVLKPVTGVPSSHWHRPSITAFVTLFVCKWKLMYQTLKAYNMKVRFKMTPKGLEHFVGWLLPNGFLKGVGGFILKVRLKDKFKFAIWILLI
uniref:Ig-like domain-containing protein n=1 Tax=Equus asinus TaxID=9793 RepID=A0A9L0JYY8_EQUAS